MHRIQSFIFHIRSSYAGLRSSGVYAGDNRCKAANNPWQGASPSQGNLAAPYNLGMFLDCVENMKETHKSTRISRGGEANPAQQRLIKYLKPNHGTTLSALRTGF